MKTSLLPRLLGSAALLASFAAGPAVRAATAPAKPSPVAPAVTPAKPLDGTAADGMIALYNIAVTDQLRISIYGQSDLTTGTHVDANGEVNLELIGQVKIVGLTLTEAQNVIAKAYQDKRMLRNPKVTINVEKYAPRQVQIQGDIKGAGFYNMDIETAMSVVDLVARAGGFTDTSKGTAVRITHFERDGTTTVREVDVDSIVKGKSKTSSNDPKLLLAPGDIVWVPMRII